MVSPLLTTSGTISESDTDTISTASLSLSITSAGTYVLDGDTYLNLIIDAPGPVTLANSTITLEGSDGFSIRSSDVSLVNVTLQSSASDWAFDIGNDLNNVSLIDSVFDTNEIAIIGDYTIDTSYQGDITINNTIFGGSMQIWGYDDISLFNVTSSEAMYLWGTNVHLNTTTALYYTFRHSINVDLFNITSLGPVTYTNSNYQYPSIRSKNVTSLSIAESTLMGSNDQEETLRFRDVDQLSIINSIIESESMGIDVQDSELIELVGNTIFQQTPTTLQATNVIITDNIVNSTGHDISLVLKAVTSGEVSNNYLVSNDAEEYIKYTTLYGVPTDSSGINLNNNQYELLDVVAPLTNQTLSEEISTWWYSFPIYESNGDTARVYLNGTFVKEVSIENYTRPEFKLVLVDVDLTGLSSSTYNVTIWANDTFGNVGTETHLVTIEDTEPILELKSSFILYDSGQDNVHVYAQVRMEDIAYEKLNLTLTVRQNSNNIAEHVRTYSLQCEEPPCEPRPEWYVTADINIDIATTDIQPGDVELVVKAADLSGHVTYVNRTLELVMTSSSDSFSQSENSIDLESNGENASLPLPVISVLIGLIGLPILSKKLYRSKYIAR